MYHLVLTIQVLFSITSQTMPTAYDEATCLRLAAEWTARSRDVPDERELDTYAMRAYCVPSPAAALGQGSTSRSIKP